METEFRLAGLLVVLFLFVYRIIPLLDVHIDEYLSCTFIYAAIELRNVPFWYAPFIGAYYNSFIEYIYTPLGHVSLVLYFACLLIIIYQYEPYKPGNNHLEFLSNQKNTIR